MNLSHVITMNSEGHVLYIFDHCNAGHLALTPCPELLAASTWPADAFESHFTDALVKQLKYDKGLPATVASIFAQLHRNSKHLLMFPPMRVLSESSESSILLQRMKSTKCVSNSVKLKSTTNNFRRASRPPASTRGAKGHDELSVKSAN